MLDPAGYLGEIEAVIEAVAGPDNPPENGALANAATSP